MDSSSREPHDVAVEALATLSEYLERSLDKGASLILVRSQADRSDIFLGDAAEAQADWTRCGFIRNALVAEILEATQPGLNSLSIDGQTYRFVRTFTQVAEHGAIVFSAA
ncbi:hypothetical protein [Paraburkholderia sp. J67]|uniref:hypothetical protein n=1 Tax=Paraburkholderia sp. J67 TaxID=2805435 RepID=UPI002ABDDE67|nr:hypothetical protein [Paraburkholderia sp. J67]